jgi:hypothetical protein
MSKAEELAHRMTTRGKTYVPEDVATLLRKQDKAIRVALELIEKVNMRGWVLADFEDEMYEAIKFLREVQG